MPLHQRRGNEVRGSKYAFLVDILLTTDSLALRHWIASHLMSNLPRPGRALWRPLTKPGNPHRYEEESGVKAAVADCDVRTVELRAQVALPGAKES